MCLLNTKCMNFSDLVGVEVPIRHNKILEFKHRTESNFARFEHYQTGAVTWTRLGRCPVRYAMTNPCVPPVIDY